MSVTLRPSSSLGFNRPLTQLVKRTLTVTNPNEQPVAFKVKTTAPKLYCVRPNSGRIEPGESVEVQVLLQAMKEEPPLNAKCKDKFLVQSTLITPEKEDMSLHDLWSNIDGEDTKVHQQKIKVVYLPPLGQAVEEEDESGNQTSYMSHGDSRFDTVRQSPGQVPNGHSPADVFASKPFPAEPPPPIERAFSPAVGEYAAAPEEHEEESHPVPMPIPQPRTPPPAQSQQRAAASPQEEELRAQLAAAQAEIARLREVLAAIPDAANGSGSSEVRRRRRGGPLSDDETVVSSSAETDLGTIGEQALVQHDGIPPHIVVGISVAVFVLTYIFF